MDIVNPSTHRPFVGTLSTTLTDQHRAMLTSMQDTLATLQTELIEADLPPQSVHKHSGRYLQHLRKIRIADTPAPGFYDINLIEGYVRFSPTLLNTLSHLDEAALARFTEVFLLHEIVHVDQGMYSVTHFGVGHASVVLEEMDYFADAFAMATCIAWQWRLHANQQQGSEQFQAIVQAYALLAIEGMEMFDRAEYPERLPAIGEARLRRYLIWHTQFVRLLGCRTFDEVLATLFPRISVELAPLQATLDQNTERQFSACSPNAQFFLSVDGYLIRQSSMPGFDVPALFEAILSYDHATAREQIRYPMIQYHEQLLPQI